MRPTDIPYPQFFDLDGSPLDGGSVYFGLQNQNPETSPITVYWDAAGTQPASQPITTLNGYTVRAGTPARLYVGTEYSISVRNKFGQIVYSNLNSADFDAASFVRDLANGTDPLKGVALVAGANRVVSSISALRALPKTGSPTALVSGYYAAGDGGGGQYCYDALDTTSADNGGTIIVASDGGRWKLQQSFAVHVKQFGVKGDNSANDTASLQAAVTAMAGKELYFGSGLTILVNASITLQSNSKYTGASAVKAMASSISGAILDGTGKSGITIDGLEIDGNAANTGAHFGVQLLNGSNNTVKNCYVHDTIEAGIRAGQESGLKILNNNVINCGRNGYTDNHGIMVYSITTTPLKNFLIEGNYVDTAYRKGITAYSASPGVAQGGVIANNRVVNCALGGVYVASAPGSSYQKDISIVGNSCLSNYNNILVSNLQSGSVDGNVCDGSTAQGIYVSDSVDVAIGDNSVVSSGTIGIQVIGVNSTPVGIKVGGNTVMYSNTTAAGYAPGIDLNGVTYSTVNGNVVLGESSSPKQTHGIAEEGPSDFNVFSDNRIAYTSSGTLLATVGANTHVRSITGKNTGIGATAPNNTLDVNGGLSLRDRSISLVNGANNNVVLPADAGVLYVSGPTGAYNISGIAGGATGRILKICNYTNVSMTINHNSASSSAGNKILIGGSADLVISAFGAVELTYIANATAWMVTGYKA